MEERQEKQNLLAQLYALRAGLSVISSKVDEVKQLELCNTNKRKEHGAVVAECEKQQRKVDELRIEAQKASDSYEREKNNRSIKIKAYSRFDLRPLDIFVLIFIALPMFVGIFLGGIGYGLFAVTLGLGTALGVSLGAVLLVLVFVVFVVIKKVRLHNEAIDLADSQIKRAREEWEYSTQELERAEKQLAKLRATVALSSAACEGTQTECDAQILQLTQEAHAYDAALTEQYSLLLATVDWENLDLVIFYLSTGRADTVKEALQQVDMQRRNDALVNEIRNANSSICREIHGGLIALSSALGECFGALRNQINAVSRQVNAQSKVIATLNGRLIDEVQLNNQLRAKANETSEQLVRDLQYIENRL